mmetsp:Transcript_17035/g.24264  ORF Transcript_17035/g.24264 Transcript_17035/m.24264 type:complete len:245 (-) Transcript_17035:83-817(-)
MPKLDWGSGVCIVFVLKNVPILRTPKKTTWTRKTKSPENDFEQMGRITRSDGPHRYAVATSGSLWLDFEMGRYVPTFPPLFLKKNQSIFDLSLKDHLSGFCFIECLKGKTADEVSRAVLRILSHCVIPEILQSDNGGDFLGLCIERINKFFPNVHVVKGRPRHPQSQGFIERGNGVFKEALNKWMTSHGADWTIGAYIVQGQLNQSRSVVKNMCDNTQSTCTHSIQMGAYQLRMCKLHVYISPV